MLHETLQVLADLVGFNTVSSQSNLPLIDYAQEQLRAAGSATFVVPSVDAGKASLWATIGPPVAGGIVLSGHSDVVPAAHQRWQTNPFELAVKDGRAYGRGTADMKGFIAVVLALAPELCKMPLTKPVHVALTFDEEVGCLGAPALIDWARSNVAAPAAVIVGEPTSMRVVNSNKGLMYCRTEVCGVEAHSSLPAMGISAVGIAGRAIELLHRLEGEYATACTNPAFDPPRTTVSVNRIRGGEAINIFADRCEFEWDIRAVPGAGTTALLQSFEERVERDILSQIQLSHPRVKLSTRVIADAPALLPDDDGVLQQRVLQLLDEQSPCSVPYAAEAGQYQRAGYRALIVGPGSIAQAHQPDEFVAIEQLERCRMFIQRLAATLQ